MASDTSAAAATPDMPEGAAMAAPGPIERLNPNLVTGTVDGGRLLDTLRHFVRLLRRLGFPLGPDATVRAVQAVQAAGLDTQRTLYWALHATLVSRRAERPLFDQAFHLIWRDPDLIGQMMSLVLPQRRTPTRPPGQELARRLAEALGTAAAPPPPPDLRPPQLELDASLTWSAAEVLATKDFEQMSQAELAAARAAMAQLILPQDRRPTRRYRPAPHGPRLDLAAMRRDMVRQGGDCLRPRRRARVVRRPPLVILCDISGSMDRYARVFLQFIHQVTAVRDEVHAFLFGTRLTPISHLLVDRDVDQALARVADATRDWSGGTRLGACLASFNRHHAARVMARAPTLVLFTDGIDREGGHDIERQMKRLRGRARQILWLNPLRRFEAWAPEAAGARALIGHVDRVLRCHTLDSLRDIADILARPQIGDRDDPSSPSLTPRRAAGALSP